MRKTVLAIVLVLSMLAVVGCKPKRTVEPMALVPPVSNGNAGETLAALHKAGARYGAYTLNRVGEQIQLQDVSVAVMNEMDVFTEPVTSSSPGRYGFGGKARVVKQDERDKVTETIGRSTATYLDKRFRVTDHAQFEVVVIVSGRNGVHIQNGFDPWGVEDIRILLLDNQSKSVIWYTDEAWGLGKTLDGATQAATSSINNQLDILLGKKKRE